MTGGDRQTDGERRRPVSIVSVLVAAGEDAQHQRVRDRQLDQEALPDGNAVLIVQRRRTDGTLFVVRRHRLEQTGTADGADALHHHVADEADRADAKRREHSDGDGGVDVTAADVAERPGDGRDGESERKGDDDDRVVAGIISFPFFLPVVSADARPAADDDEQERADQLGD